MATPAGLLFAKVVGRYQMFQGDTLSDTDDLPDFVPFEGTGFIKPDLVEARNTNPGETSFYLPKEIPVTVVDGWITDKEGNPYVMLLRSSPGVTPQDFSYRISLSLRPQGSSDPYIEYGPFSFMAVPDPQTGVVDLPLVTPVISTPGTQTIIGPRGPGNLVISPTQPTFEGPGMWVQTGLGPTGQDFTIWIEDGL
jgi:hypothetical protein